MFVIRVSTVKETCLSGGMIVLYMCAQLAYICLLEKYDPTSYIRHGPFTKNELKGKASQRISQLG